MHNCLCHENPSEFTDKTRQECIGLHSYLHLGQTITPPPPMSDLFSHKKQNMFAYRSVTMVHAYEKARYVNYQSSSLSKTVNFSNKTVKILWKSDKR